MPRAPPVRPVGTGGLIVRRPRTAMPEDDVVWAATRRPDEALAERALTVSDFRVPRAAAVDLRGRVVREVSRAASTCSPGSTAT